MDKSQRTLQYISGGLFVVSFIWNLYLIRYVGPVNLSILWSIATILLAVAMFTGKKRLFSVGITIHLVAALLYSIGSIPFVQDFLPFVILFRIIFTGTFIGFVLCVIAYALILISMRNNQKQSQFIIIAVILLCVGSVINYFHCRVGILAFLRMVIPAVIPISFAVFALQKPHKLVAVSDDQKKSQLLNDVERLTKLKELLDAGFITQEEFDEKKKQVLGL